MWRWDQGRLLYFQYDVLKNIATVLAKFDGVKIAECESLFRKVLTESTGLPFAPSHYTVLRNYKRVFECAFLATVSDKHLIVSDFCKELAKPDGEFSNADDFLLSYVNRFRYPFPAFDSYDNAQKSIYPFCAIIKYLIYLRRKGLQPRLSIDDIFLLLIANQCTGTEELDYYDRISEKRFEYDSDEKRQLREMVIFLSQLSILKYYDGCIWLEEISDNATNELVSKFLSPSGGIPKGNRTEEFMELTKISGGIVLPAIEVFSSDVADVEFIEGKRRRVEHFRVDRSPLLRRYFRDNNRQPVCNMCHLDVSKKYPWTDYMLDIHHLLPLSSGVAITPRGTSLDDIVGLCPSCHRSIHIYYTKWLRERNQEDFCNHQEAKGVYLAAAKEIS